ncbi:MAG: hypothetical protein M1338_00935 [Patescibacteria group bacterium]|nr:hypothetical protein [Patescibacteria group bacterium]
MKTEKVMNLEEMRAALPKLSKRLSAIELLPLFAKIVLDCEKIDKKTSLFYLHSFCIFTTSEPDSESLNGPEPIFDWITKYCQHDPSQSANIIPAINVFLDNIHYWTLGDCIFPRNRMFCDYVFHEFYLDPWQKYALAFFKDFIENVVSKESYNIGLSIEAIKTILQTIKNMPVSVEMLRIALEIPNNLEMNNHELYTHNTLINEIRDFLKFAADKLTIRLNSCQNAAEQKATRKELREILKALRPNTKEAFARGIVEVLVKQKNADGKTTGYAGIVETLLA